METKKQKIIKVLKRIGIGLSIGFNFLFLLAIIIGSVGNKKQVNCCLAESNNVVEKVNNELPKRYVSYNDDSYTITLSSTEVNDITFTNLATYLNGLFPYEEGNSDSTNIGSISYNNVVRDILCTHYELSIFSYAFGTPNPKGTFSRDGVFTLSNDSGSLPFEYDLVFVLDSAYYDGFKSAVQQDLVIPTINDGIFETLTSGVVAFIGSLGAGISSMVGVFYDSANSQLTTIGLLSVIVVAVSLAYFLFRLIIGLIRMRG